MHKKRQVYKAFWDAHPLLSRKKTMQFTEQGYVYPADVREAFSDFVNRLHEEGLISDKMAQSIKLPVMKTAKNRAKFNKGAQ